MGYYDGKTINTINRDNSNDQINHNNSVLLPELKSITP